VRPFRQAARSLENLLSVSAVNISAIVDRAAEIAMAAWKTLNGLSGEMLAIVIVGAIGAAISLGCVMVGLFVEWREWVQNHLYKRGDD
jgi:hypothetical protein